MNKIINRHKAFTLVELLVVIAVISLLSSVIYASVSSARVKAKEAKVTQTVKEIATQAAVAFDSTSGYPTLDGESGVLTPLIDSINESGVGYATFYKDSVNNPNNEDWGVTVVVGSDTAVDYPDNVEEYSVSHRGVVRWDDEDTLHPTTSATTMDWATGVSACEAKGMRLPKIEELKTLYNSYYAEPYGMPTIPGFASTSYYWSGSDYYYLGTAYPNSAHIMFSSSGYIASNQKAGFNFRVRCVY